MLYFKYYTATEYSTLYITKPIITWIYESAAEMANDFDVHRTSIYKIMKHKDGRFC